MSSASVASQPAARTVVDLALDGIDGRVTLSLKREATTLSVNTIPSYSFDLAGRVVGGFNDDRTYRRTLDHRLIEKQGRVEDGRRTRERRTLDPDERRAWIDGAYCLARQVFDALRDGRFEVLGETVSRSIWQPRATAALAAIAAWDDDALAADAQTFLRVYEPIGILPPDQYRALALQATLSCSYNKCTFCTFYRGRAFRIKTLPEFEAHLAEVAAYHGPALPWYQSVFLGEANALITPQRLLLPMLDLVRRRFPGLGVYAFVSAPDALRKSVEDIVALRALGLRRVYIGLESGDEGLLQFLAKPNTAAQALDAVQTIKAGGVAVGVVVLLGVGGHHYAADHVAHTVDIVNAMRLDPDDLLYFSEFVEAPDSEYARRAQADDVRPLTQAEMRAQRAAIQGGLRFPGRPPRFAVYDIREFAY